MAQSLYRTYRPQTFADLVGQDHISRTLQNAVAEGSVSHAYLFTGPRGTGKTTTARILAKALLCEGGPKAEPDGTCPECLDIAEGTHPDVYELDAASRTGVDAVRDEIIGRVQFAPTRGGYKVYIIDEVHMLSAAAFNALLKTLEEPPAHVVFILCTTHPHKVPDTIHSRCQRFDFRRISNEDLVSRLRFISDSEGFVVDDHALTLIAKHASGGMRDAITTLEQLAAFTGGKIGLDDVEGLIGEVDESQLFDIAELIGRRDIAGCFRWVASFVESGTDLAQFTKDLTAHMRDLYVSALTGGEGSSEETDRAKSAHLKSQCAEFGGPDRLARALEVLGDLSSELRDATDPRLRLEIAFTRLCRPSGENGWAALAERVESLELAVSMSTPVAGVTMAAPSAPAPVAAPQPVAPAPASKAKPAEPVAPKAAVAATETKPAPQPAPQAATRAVAPGARLDLATARRSWPAVVAEMKKIKPSRGTMYENAAIDVDPDGTLVIMFPKNNAFAVTQASQPEARDLVAKGIRTIFHADLPFRVAAGTVSAAACPPPAAPAPSHAPVAAPAAAPVPAPAPSREPDPTPVVAEELAGDPLAALLASTFGGGIVIEEEAYAEPVDEQGEDL